MNRRTWLMLISFLGMLVLTGGVSLCMFASADNSICGSVTASHRYSIAVEGESKATTDSKSFFRPVFATAPQSAAAKKNGFNYIDGKWRYCINKKVRTSLTGLVQGTIDGMKGWYYVKKGVFKTDTGLSRKAEGKDKKWYFVKNGKYKASTGIARKLYGKDKNWYFVKKGVFMKATVLAKKADGSSKTLYFVKGGMLNKYTGDIRIGKKKYPLYKGAVQDNGWKAVYRDILDKNTLLDSNFDGNRNNDKTVTIIDIGGNSIPELLLHRGSGSSYMLNYLDIYTYINGNAIEVASMQLPAMGASGKHEEFHLLKNGELCYKQYFGSDYYAKIEYTYYSFENGRTLKQKRQDVMTFTPKYLWNPSSKDWYPMKTYRNEKYCGEIKTKDQALSMSDQITGFKGNSKSIVATRLSGMMTKTEVVEYLK